MQNSSKISLTLSVCAATVLEIIERSMEESDSALFYRQQIEKCEEYIRNIQAQTAYNWESPIKPEQLQNIEDVEFFQSQFCLKKKLQAIKDIKQDQKKKRTSQHFRNNSIRASVKTRNSSISVFSWSEQKYKNLIEQKESKLRDKKISKQISLQKLTVFQKNNQQSRTQKQLRTNMVFKQKNNSFSRQKKKSCRQIFRKTQKSSPQQKDKIPMLIELGYSIENTQKISLKNKQTMKAKIDKQVNQKQNISRPLSTKLGCKLKIDNYESNIGLIKINNWKKFNAMVNNNMGQPQNIQQQFTNIAYYSDFISSK